MEIRANEVIIEPGKIQVSLEEIPTIVSTTLPSTTFWLNTEQADKLAFELNSVLQDMELKEKEKT